MSEQPNDIKCPKCGAVFQLESADADGERYVHPDTSKNGLYAMHELMMAWRDKRGHVTIGLP